MSKLFRLLICAYLVSVTPATSAEVSGTISYINTKDHIVALTNGAEFALSNAVSISKLETGDLVGITYNINSGEFIATNIAPISSPKAPSYNRFEGRIIQIDVEDYTIAFEKGPEFVVDRTIDIRDLIPGDQIAVIYEFTPNGPLVRKFEIVELNKTAQKVVLFSGTIFEIDDDTHTIILNNGTEFIVKDAVDLSSVHPGDNIDFTAMNIDGQLVIIKISLGRSKV